MMRKFLSALLVLTLLGALAVQSALAAPIFPDVPEDAWYAADVDAVAQAGIINGRGDGTFDPDANISLAETIKLATVVHAQRSGSGHEFLPDDPWYRPYEEYLNMVADIWPLRSSNPNSIVTRSQFAQLMAISLSTFSDDELAMNTVEDGGIPDLHSASAHADVYALYRAGILTGSDGYGSFRPSSYITRAEVAAIVHRFIDPAVRKSVTLTKATAAAAPAAGSDGDQTGWDPPGWTWQTEGTEGYDLPRYTAGKYVRTDGSAVLYIDRSFSDDFFAYWMYVACTTCPGKTPFVLPEDPGDMGTLGFAEVFNAGDGTAGDLYHNLHFEDTGYDTIQVYAEWIDDLFDFWPDPSGTYLLVREKTPG